MTALNLLKLRDRKGEVKRGGHVISIQRMKVRKFNEYLINRIISLLDLPPTFIKLHPDYQTIKDYGAVAGQSVRSVEEHTQIKFGYVTNY
jgi:hypothetical protein